MCISDKPQTEFWKNQGACKICQRDYRRNNVDRKNKSDRAAWEHGLRTKFGITPDEYFVFLEEQGEVCAICGKDDSPRRLAVDHCHETGRIRGLLCRRCNMALGLFRDDPESVRKALRYLMG